LTASLASMGMMAGEPSVGMSKTPLTPEEFAAREPLWNVERQGDQASGSHRTRGGRKAAKEARAPKMEERAGTARSGSAPCVGCRSIRRSKSTLPLWKRPQVQEVLRGVIAFTSRVRAGQVAFGWFVSRNLRPGNNPSCACHVWGLPVEQPRHKEEFVYFCPL
jgi:hypothetical protein